jgi:hypothetical protein
VATDPKLHEAMSVRLRIRMGHSDGADGQCGTRDEAAHTRLHVRAGELVRVQDHAIAADQ